MNETNDYNKGWVDAADDLPAKPQSATDPAIYQRGYDDVAEFRERWGTRERQATKMQIPTPEAP